MHRRSSGDLHRRVRAIVSVCLTVFLVACVPPLEDEMTIDGTWSGVGSHTYYCESGPETVQFSLSGESIALSDGSATEYLFPVNMPGTLVEQFPGRYAVIFDSDEPLAGLLIVDAGGSYAILVMDAPAFNEGNRNGFVAVLRKAPLSAVTVNETDLVGEWSGVTVRVNASFEVTASSASSAVVSNPDGLELAGQDDEGPLVGGIALSTLIEPSSNPGIWESRSGNPAQVLWSDLDVTRDAVYLMSADKSVVAVAFLTSLCDQSIFHDLPAQRFALWARE